MSGWPRMLLTKSCNPCTMLSTPSSSSSRPAGGHMTYLT
jgi:hypothetical protein